eukprot:358313-Chlamydomonas_euryale.AAC.10
MRARWWRVPATDRLTFMPSVAPYSQPSRVQDNCRRACMYRPVHVEVHAGGFPHAGVIALWV